MNEIQETEADHHHYVVTEDLFPLMTGWAHRHKFNLPERSWFAHNHRLLRQAIEVTFEAGGRVALVDSLPWHYITEEIQQLVYYLHSSMDIDLGCVISLDRVYGLNISCPHHMLEINRVTDLDGVVADHDHRPHAGDVDQQISQIVNSLTSYHIILVDDGIWTGDTMRWAVRMLQNHNLTVAAIVVGVQVKRPGQTVDYGMKPSQVKAVQSYSVSRPVLDWVCERDFFIGTPLGGRTIASHERINGASVGAFYSMKAKWLKDWASLDDPDGSFRRFCVERSIELFVEIERRSGRQVLFGDLDRWPHYTDGEYAIQKDAVVTHYLGHFLE